jgi:hypothetical protein
MVKITVSTLENVKRMVFRRRAMIERERKEGS